MQQRSSHVLKLTNSLSKKLEELVKKPGETVTIYSCGPTVYDQAHIGNLRSFIMDDLLRRTIVATYGRDKFKAVMNITDVDDKTIAAAEREYPDLYKTDPKAALAKSTEHYTDLLLADLKAVGIDLDLFTIVKATDDLQMKRMGELIKQISAKGFAYVADGSVYFDLAKYREKHAYGQLVNVDFGHQKARIDNDEYDKAEAQDFVLWKATRAGEPSWNLELGDQVLPGRPGWHIECSAMSVGELGQPFDIHTGGIDLKFPHHENEIAQTLAASDQKMATIFVHWNHLFVDGKKMSKSLKNFYTRSDIEKKGFSPLAFRLLAMQAHYSNELNFTWGSLEAAQSSLANFYAWADSAHQSGVGDLDEIVIATELHEFGKLLQDDLPTPKGLADLVLPAIAAMPTDWRDVRFLDGLLGLNMIDRPDITKEQKLLIRQREEARAIKDFNTSDKLRKSLSDQDLEIHDGIEGSTWRRTKL